MQNIINLISPNSNFDLMGFSHNLILAVPSCILVGFIFFYILGSINSLKSKVYRIWISGSFTFMLSFTVAFYNLGVPLETLLAVYSDWLHLIIRWIQ